MIKRTTEQWLALFEAHKKSDVSQAQFCKEHGLCPKYFSVRRRQLTGAGDKSKFVHLQRPRRAPRPLDTEWQLSVGGVKVRVLGATMEQIVGLIKGLA